MTSTPLMIQFQYQNKSDSDAASNSDPQSQSYSHPVALMGLEVKLEGQVLHGALVCNSHSPIPNHDIWEIEGCFL
jgi:hypothetical protein